MRRIAYGLCLAAMLGLLAYMNLVTLPVISAEAQGLLPFDLRATGYGVAEAQAFLTVLSPDGRAVYLGLQHRLDTVYPPLLAVVLIWTYLSLLPRRWALAASVIALAAAGVDLLENARVAHLLRATAPTVAEIAAASLATVGKTWLVSAALVMLAYSLVLAVWRWWRRG